jgi:lipid II:glycine glycyltransferase (peptidoglycan interpeptide bridge formation enzyme)
MEWIFWDEAQRWNAFVKQNGPRSGAFLQSWEWGEYQEALGDHIVRYACMEKGEMRGVATIVKINRSLGMRFAYCPRGPLFSDKISLDDQQRAVSSLGKICQADFLRFEPAMEGKDRWAQKAHKSATIQPSETLLLDLSLSQDTLLSSMHHKTRYNIRLAERKGVQVEKREAKDWKIVWPLFEETAARDGFRLHPCEHYERLLEYVYGAHEGARTHLVTASLEGIVIASAIFVDMGGTRTYLHGATSSQYREVMAPYLLHWRCILEAQQAGMRWYDFWGISHTHPSWAGFTRFKKGFGGEEVHYPGTFDLVLDWPKYLLYALARRLLYGRRY